MSKLLTLLNKVKAQANKEFLTNTQLKALVEIEKIWKYPERINLYGPEGCGKTMVGWIVSQRNNAVFCSSQQSFFDLSDYSITHAILDNVTNYQTNLRRLIAELQIKRNRNTLFITTQPNKLGFPCVFLPNPSSDDISVVYNNLSLLGYYSSSIVKEGNLWKVIHSVL